MLKTKILVSNPLADRQVDPSKYPCGVCKRGVGNNSIYCHYCKNWVHHRCSGMKGRLRPDPNYKCRTCSKERVVTAPQVKQVEIGNEQLEVVKSFCYLGDVTNESGGCYSATSARIRSAWKKFHELIPIVCNKSFSLVNRGHIYNTCVRSVLLYACETWPLNVEDISRLTKADNSMVRWICSIKLTNRHSMTELREKLKLISIEEHIKSCRLRWFGHVTRMSNNCWPKIMLDFNVEGTYPRGRPKKRWMENIKNDIKTLNINAKCWLNS